MSPEPEPTEAELDDFWRDLRAQMLSDYMPMEVANQRMTTDAPPLPQPTIDRIVDRVMQKATLSVAPLPRAPGSSNVQRLWFGRLSQAAAAGTLSALLLSAGVFVYLMWPENRDPTGIHSPGMRFDDATRILTDPGQEMGRRMNALGRTVTRVQIVVQLLKELSAAGGELGRTADVYLLRFRLSLETLLDVEFELGTVEYLKPLTERVKDGGLSLEQRASDLQRAAQEALYGLSSIIEAGATESGNTDFDTAAKASLSRLRAQLDS
jgi:hypothetical protein